MRLIAALVLPFLLAACAGSAPRVERQGGAGPQFVLEEVFAGRGRGEGAFVNSITKSRRPFTVAFDGRRTKDGLILKENIAYADGKRENPTWRFVRLGPGRYEGRREGVVGVAKGVVEGDTLRLSYDLDVGGVTLHFEDVLVQRAPGVIENKAKATKLGVQVGTVDISIRMGRRR